MDQESILSQILKYYQRKYTIICEIYRLTLEMTDTFAHNDHVSTQLILNMRQEEMDRADQCSSSLALLEDSMSVTDRQHLRSILQSEEGHQLANTWEEKKILELYSNIQSTLKKTIEVDKRLNSKIAGQDSYYQKDNRL